MDDKSLKMTLESLPIGIGIYEICQDEIHALYLSDYALDIFGFDSAEYAQRIRNKEPVWNSAEAWPDLGEFLTSGRRTSEPKEIKVRRKDGSEIWIWVRAELVRYQNRLLIYAVIDDITGLKEKQAKEDWKNRRYRILNDLTHAISYDYEAKSDTLYYYIGPSRDAKVEERILPNYLTSFIDSPKSTIEPGSDEYRRSFELAREGHDRGVAEYRANYYGTGYRSYRTEWFKVRNDRDPDDYHLVGLVIDIEEELRLRHSAEYDALTGLLNRYATEVKIDACLADKTRDHRLDACVVLDLDNFKQVNDLTGHLRGDDLLRNFGKILIGACGESDILGRVGGDEFFIYFRDCTVERAIAVLTDIEAETQKLYHGMSVSMGVYVPNGDETRYADLMSKTDIALYEAKREGKSRIAVYDPSLEEKRAVCSENELLTLEHSIVIDSLNVSISKYLIDEHFTLISANSYYYRLFGYEKEEYEELFHNRRDLFYKNYPQQWQALVDVITRMLERGETSYETVCRVPHKSGKMLWIKLSGALTGEEIGGAKVAYSVMTDITEQMQNKQEKTITYSNIPGLIAKFRIHKGGFTLLDANSRYYEVFRGRREFPLDILIEAHGLDKMGKLHPSLRKGLPFEIEFDPLDKHDKRLYMQVKGVCIDWIQGDPIYLLIYQDVTELVQQRQLLEAKNRELEYLTHIDPITEGINRRRFEELARDLIAKSPKDRYALVWLDIDRFKLINDIGGTELGNQALKYIFGKIKSCLGDDELISRVFADNFAILMHNDSNYALSERLEKIATAANDFSLKDGTKYMFTFSAGIYRVHSKNVDIVNMEDRANLSRNKDVRIDSNQCKCSFYSDDDRKVMLAEKDIENRMWNALDMKEFEVFLQPKVCLHNEHVCGAEALVRWRDRERGLIAPAVFIPVFEKNGFIVRLDIHVFREVCRTLADWLARGIPAIPVSVNVSRVHFTDPKFVDEYAAICDEYGVPHSLIEIEVTETIVFDDPDKFKKVVANIHAHGFSCSMDDFGSGYSSLNVLKDIDVDTIKLDQHFFSSIDMTDEKECSIIETMVDLAQKLHIRSLAEGVETREQKEFLRRIKCNQAQGFFYSRPIPISDFENLVFHKETE